MMEGKLVFPAVAIPVERKSAFECPDEHLQALTDILPQVNKILTIGWRATEQHFFEMLRTHLRQRVSVMSVSGNRSEAEATISNLLKAVSNPQELIPAYSGFTDLIRNHDVE